MSERNVEADLASVRRAAGAKLGYAPPTATEYALGQFDLSVARAAEIAEVTRRNWQRWEKRGSLPKAVLDRFWRHVDELAEKQKDKAR